MIIAMAGLPGTGKSVIARQLVQHLAAVILDKDQIRAALFRPELVEYSKRQDNFCMEVAFKTASYIINTNPGQHIIIDGRTFSQNYQVEVLLSFTTQLNTPLRIIECVCSDASAQRRLTQDVTEGAHLARNRNFALYMTIKERFEIIQAPKLVVNTDNDLEECVRQCLAYLKQETAITVAN